MNDVTLPSASFGSSPLPDADRLADRSSTDAHRLAWQREMERAQSQSWFWVEPARDAGAAFPALRGTAPPSLAGTGRVSIGRGIGPSPARRADGRGHEGGPSLARPDPRESPRGRETTASLPMAARREAAPPATARFLAGPVQRGPYGADGAVTGASNEGKSPTTTGGTRATPANPQLPSQATCRIELVGAIATTPARANATTQAVPAVDVILEAPSPSLPMAAGLAATPDTPADSSPRGAVGASRAPVPILRVLEAPQPLRLHIEWSGEVATVWIGADANALGDVPALVEALWRSMGRAGARLRNVICNGDVLFTAATEQPMLASRPVPSPARAGLLANRIVVEGEN